MKFFDSGDIKDIMKQVLYEFPIREICIDMPRWINSLAKDHWLKANVFSAIKESAANVRHIADVAGVTDRVCACEYVSRCAVEGVSLGMGSARISVTLNGDLFYRILGEVTGIEIEGEAGLMPCMIELAEIKRKNKELLAIHAKRSRKVILNPDAIFDVQSKRLHEYKRQLLNVLHIIALYQQLQVYSEQEVETLFQLMSKLYEGIERLTEKINQEANHEPDSRPV